MAAYNIDKITKQFPQIWKKKKAKELIKSHHIAAIVSDNIVLTPNGRFSYTEEYDYVKAIPHRKKCQIPPSVI